VSGRTNDGLRLQSKNTLGISQGVLLVGLRSGFSSGGCHFGGMRCILQQGLGLDLAAPCWSWVTPLADIGNKTCAWVFTQNR
jgi:hypothetical protein